MMMFLILLMVLAWNLLCVLYCTCLTPIYCCYWNSCCSEGDWQSEKGLLAGLRHSSHLQELHTMWFNPVIEHPVQNSTKSSTLTIFCITETDEDESESDEEDVLMNHKGLNREEVRERP